jgi:hypothetical protein
MIPADVSEAERIAVLHALQILDTAPDPGLDALVQLAAVTFGTSSAAISLIDEDRQWLKARVGALAAETRRDITFCNHTVQRDAVLVVNDAAVDPIFQDNPLVCGGPAIRFYAGAPLTVAGARIGALCVIDQVPRADFDLAAQATLMAMAKAIAATLELRHEVKLRRALARSLTEQTKKLALAESMAGVGHWDMDVRTGAVAWSHEMFRIHGVEQGKFIPTLEGALSFLPAEDREAVQAALDAATRFGDSFKLRVKLVRGWDKALRVVSVGGEVTLGAGGTPDAVFGVVHGSGKSAASDTAGPGALPAADNQCHRHDRHDGAGFNVAVRNARGAAHSGLRAGGNDRTKNPRLHPSRRCNNGAGFIHQPDPGRARCACRRVSVPGTS